MKNVFTLLILALATLLTACASLNGTKHAGGAEVDSRARPVMRSESILEYTGRVLAMPAEGQKLELVKLNERLAMNKYNFDDRTKLAIIYALSPSPEIRDTARAQTLLDELARDNDPDLERSTLTRILRDNLAESSRITKENNRLNLKMHDEQKRADMLQEKLEELKKIEKTIVDRKVLDK